MSLFEKFVSFDEKEHKRINIFEAFDNLDDKTIAFIKRSSQFNHLEKLTQQLYNLLFFTFELQ